MAALTIRDVSRRSGLSEPTLRYYEDMRVYQANRARGHSAAAEQRDLLLRHAERIEAEIAAQYARLDYLRHKAALWDARARGDEAGEAEAWQRVKEAFDRMDLEMEVRR